MGIYVGIDLAGSEKRQSGVAVISFSAIVELRLVRTDDEILEIIERWSPNIVAIDSPLQRSDLPYRECDLKLKLMGLPPLPLTLPGMKMLVERALKLKEKIEGMGAKVIETFPAAALRVLGFEKKPKNKSERAKLVREVLSLFGIRREVRMPRLTEDEMDAILCAIAALSYDSGHYLSVKGSNCEIILPLLPNQEPKGYPGRLGL